MAVSCSAVADQIRHTFRDGFFPRALNMLLLLLLNTFTAAAQRC
jgi:hypothetical protein